MPMNIVSPFLSELKLCLRVCRESEGMTLGKLNEEEEEGIVAFHFIEFGDKFVKLKFSYSRETQEVYWEDFEKFVLQILQIIFFSL
jgi:hypothetical protein